MTLSTLPNIQGTTVDFETVRLADLAREGRYTLVWWNPETVTPESCRSCGGGSETLRLIERIYEAGSEIVGLSYSSPGQIKRYQEDLGLVYPILTADRQAALLHRAARLSDEEWRGTPRRIAYLVDDQMRVINRYDVHDPKEFLRKVLGDVQAGPPPSKWEQKKPSLWRRVFA